MPDKRTSPSKPVNGVVARPMAVDVSQRLRELRTGRGLSIRVLAGLSQLNVNTLSLIENNKTSPSVSTLQQLATVLVVPITAFFENDLPKNSLVYLTANRRPRVTLTHGLLEDLSAGLTSRAVQPFVLTLEPHANSGPQPIVHTGVEFVYCLRGQISYQVEDRAFALASCGVVSAQRAGHELVYELASPKIAAICDLMREVLTEQLAQQSAIARGLDKQP